jgi:putrescine transport system substrate-binding protein
VLEQMAKVDPGNQYLVNWLWGYVTVGINTGKVKAALGATPMPANPWALIFEPAVRQQAQGLRHQPAGLGLRGAAGGDDAMPARTRYSKNAKDYDAAREVLARPAPVRHALFVVGLHQRPGRGPLCVVMGYSGDINIARQRAIDSKSGQDIQALIPPSAATLFFDSMAIPKDAKHVKNAHLFINYILRPEVHAG